MLFDQAELTLWLNRELMRYGTVKNFATYLSLHPRTLRKILEGKKPPTRKLLDKVGFEATVRYRRKACTR